MSESMSSEQRVQAVREAGTTAPTAKAGRPRASKVTVSKADATPTSSAKRATKAERVKYVAAAIAKATAKPTDDERTALEAGRAFSTADPLRLRVLANIEGKVKAAAERDGRTVATPNSDAYLAAKAKGATAKAKAAPASRSHAYDKADMRKYITAAIKADPSAKRTPTSVRYSREHLGRSADLSPAQWWPWCEVWAEVASDPWAAITAKANAAGIAYDRDAMLTWAKGAAKADYAAVVKAKADREQAAKAKAKATAKRKADAAAKASAAKGAAKVATKAKAKRPSTTTKAAAKASAKRPTKRAATAASKAKATTTAKRGTKAVA